MALWRVLNNTKQLSKYYTCSLLEHSQIFLRCRNYCDIQSLKKLQILHFTNNSTGLQRHLCFAQHRPFHCSLACKATGSTDEDILKEKKRKKMLPKITLYMPDGSMMVTDEENAGKIAKRRNLKLVKQGYDSKGERNVYKLIEATSMIEREEVHKTEKQKHSLKSMKLFMISDKISSHDLATKMKNASKLLSKMHIVKIIIQNDSGNRGKLVKAVTDGLKEFGTVRNESVKETATIIVISPNVNGTVKEDK